jgi:xanthine dehydrogenase accessory factor
VAFAEAVHEGQVQVEELIGVLAKDTHDLDRIFSVGHIPVLVDQDLKKVKSLKPQVIVDARMQKIPPEDGLELAPFVIGLGPGFFAGKNCHAAIETNRGHHLGRVIWEGAPEANTGTPGLVRGYSSERVLRAPIAGKIANLVKIGDQLKQGDRIARVGDQEIKAPFDGILRGLIRQDTQVEAGQKIGDLDPRLNPELVKTISDKSMAIAGGVLEAILSRDDLRNNLWT